MPRCGRCGAEGPEGARFCMSCGQSIAAEPSRPPPSPPSSRRAAPSADDLARADRLLTEAFGLSDEGRLTDAVRVTQQVVTLNPNSTTAHSLLGTLYERLGNRDAAIKEYQAVLSLSPGSTADRQRLNELLGLPATPEAVQSPGQAGSRMLRRPELLYYAAIPLLIILIIVILVSRSDRNEGNPAPAPTQVAALPQPVAPSAQPTSAIAPIPVPGLPEAVPVPNPATGPAMQPAPVPTPAASAPAPAAQAQAAAPVEAQVPPPPERPLIFLPFRGYRPPQESPRKYLPGGGTVMNTPLKVTIPSSPSGTNAPGRGVQSNVALARRFAANGYLQDAAQVYESTLARQPQASPKVREELASIYARSGQPGKAATQYQRAYDQYRDLLNQGVKGIEAKEAQHGLSTSRAALRAMGIDVQ